LEVFGFFFKETFFKISYLVVYSKLGVPIKTTISANVLEEALNGTVTVRPLPVGTSVSGKVLAMFMTDISYNYTLSFLLMYLILIAGGKAMCSLLWCNHK
jgi:hypothetical protein